MTLEVKLNLDTPHNFQYYVNKNSPQRLKHIIQKDKTTQYIIDNCIFSKPLNLVRYIHSNYNENSSVTQVSNHLLNCAYGQIKAITVLSDNNQLLITYDIYSEFKNSFKLFRKYSSILLTNFEKEPTIKPELETLLKLRSKMNKLSKILKKSIYNNSEIVDLMSEEFKNSPFYLETMTRNGKSKNISNSDLGLYMLATGQNTYSNDFKETKLITNDYDILHQGIVVFDREQLKSPIILKPHNLIVKYGRYHFDEYYSLEQPKVSSKKLQQILDLYERKNNE